MTKSKKAISVLSGGLDSTVATSLLAKDYEVHALTFDYGQRSAEVEIKSSMAICEELGMEHTVIKLPWLAQLGKSVLTSEGEIPQLKMDELDDKELCDETARKVWVPGRNVVFTAIALSFAEAEGAEKIIVGWDLEEAATFPDNSPEFLEAFNRLLEIGSLDEVEIEAPLIHMNKEEIVKLGNEIKAPMDLSYSCYIGEEKHCGTCESCMRRKRAFKTAGIEDRTEYEE
ncbi:MAG: 7-cyano-7-deazaguanine synthase [Methanobacterium sp.]|jgi:7-cyano-7-deazaguanine synthase|uniref:7-cyano-7-deazaguanine synthase QueC n=1 Tax=Methanobacterium sp. TaxID=2164 RepID=UPI0024AAFF02|nr:7-cyano-7-deazaguanine synthase QueC [Methanobacterium sp.]MDI3549656.1 7-cyano-7-deazaguanine synthase [Methanobacterium sp.]